MENSLTKPFHFDSDPIVEAEIVMVMDCKNENKERETSGDTVTATKFYRSIDPRPDNYFRDWYIHWIPTFIPDKRKLYEHIQDKLTTKLDNIIAEEEFEFDPVSIICSKLSISFLHLLLEEWIDATTFLTRVTCDIETAFKEGLIDSGYQKGFEYLRQSLEAYKLSLTEHENFSLYLEECIRFEDLEEKEVLAVQAGKAYFQFEMKLIPIPILSLRFKELCQADPEQIIWKLKALEALRSQRKEENWFSAPSIEEKELVSQCLELEPDSVRVTCAVVEFLGDALKYHGWKQTDGPLVLTEQMHFKDERQIHNFVLSVTRREEVWATFQNSLRIEIAISHVCANATDWSILNPESELNIARLNCLIKALTIRRDSSRLYHRIGNFYHGVGKDLDEALTFYRKAYELDPWNFPALIDTLKLLIRDLDENREELERIFEEELHPNLWDDKRCAEIHFLHGLVCFLEGKNVECLEAWESAYKLAPQAFDVLKFFYSQCKRFRWTHKNLNTQKVQSFLEAQARSEMVACALANVTFAVDKQNEILRQKKKDHNSVSGLQGHGRRVGVGTDNWRQKHISKSEEKSKGSSDDAFNGNWRN